MVDLILFGKRLKSLMIVSLGFLLLAASCEKDESRIDALRIVAEGQGGGSKSALAPDGSGYWVVGETVNVLGNTYSVVEENGKHYIKNVAISSGDVARALYPATIYSSGDMMSDGTITINYPRTYTYETATINGTTLQKIGVPMAAGNTYNGSNSQLFFYHLGACVAVKITNNTANTVQLDSIVVSCEQQISGAATITLNAGYSSSPSFAVGTGVTQQNTSVAVTGIPDIAAGGSQTIFVPILRVDNANGFTVKQYKGGFVESSLTKANALSLGRGEMAYAPMARTTTVAAEGEFSVSATKRVKIAPANLQYQASTNTWRFADNAYDLIGNAAGNNTTSNRNSQSSWIDLFGYGTSGYNAGQTAYQPYTTNSSSADYIKQNLTGSYANSDWGIYNAISNGGNSAGMWRTPTRAEFDYMLNGRSGNRFIKTTVNSVKGLLLFPDNYADSNSVWTSAGTITFTTSNINNATASMSGTISSDEWAAMMELGFAFLPSGNMYTRNATTINAGGNNGTVQYWTATYYALFQSNYYACILSFGDGTNANECRTKTQTTKYGCNVRLVQDVE